MPRYTYRCRKCGRTYDRIEAMIAEPHQTCLLPVTSQSEACGGEVYRVIGHTAVQYKGSGFYSTDYNQK